MTIPDNDNDTPIIASADGKRMFAVNGNSNTIAVFDILADGALTHVPGSLPKSGARITMNATAVEKPTA